MKLKELEDFGFFRLHPQGRMLVKTGIINDKGHLCMVVSENELKFVDGKNGNKVPVPSTGEIVYYPSGQNIFRV